MLLLTAKRAGLFCTRVRRGVRCGAVCGAGAAQCAVRVRSVRCGCSAVCGAGAQCAVRARCGCGAVYGARGGVRSAGRRGVRRAGRCAERGAARVRSVRCGCAVCGARGGVRSAVCGARRGVRSAGARCAERGVRSAARCAECGAGVMAIIDGKIYGSLKVFVGKRKRLAFKNGLHNLLNSI